MVAWMIKNLQFYSSCEGRRCWSGPGSPQGRRYSFRFSLQGENQRNLLKDFFSVTNLGREHCLGKQLKFFVLDLSRKRHTEATDNTFVVSCFPLIPHGDKYRSQVEVNLPISRVMDSVLSSPSGQLAAVCQSAAATERVSGGVACSPA